MNRIFVLLAAAWVGAGAQAQSNSALYGRMDIGYGRSNGGYYEGRSAKKFSQFSGAGVTPIWGIRGKEDLGGGLSASYAFEWKVITEGAAATRLSMLGLESAWGQIDLGRMQTVASTTLGEYDLGWSPNIGGAFSLAGVSAINQKIRTSIRARQSDQIRYTSPGISGLTLRASLVLKGDRDVTQDRAASDLHAIAATFKNGDLGVGLAYESKLNDAAQSSGAWGAGVRYDFGTFVAGASCFDNHHATDGKGCGASVSIPFGAFSFGMQYARNHGATVDGAAVRPAVAGFFSNYRLSRRSSLYFNAGRMNQDALSFQAAQRRLSWAAGITHGF